MHTRTLAALLWAAAAAYGCNVLMMAAGLPEALSLVLGVLVGLVVWLDPTGRLWTHKPG